MPAMFDRGPIPRRELWRGWLVLRWESEFLVSVIGGPLIGAVGTFMLLRRIAGDLPAWQIAGVVVAGLILGLLVAFELLRRDMNFRRTRKVLSSFDGVLTEQIRLRPIGPEDGPMLPKVYDPVMLEANGLLADTAKRHQTVLATGYWWDSSQILTILDQASGEILGFAHLNGLGQDGVPEAGLSLGPWARGRGLAREVVGAIGQAVAAAGYSQLRMGTRQENKAMRRSLEGAGAIHTESAPYDLPNGERVLSAWYVLTLTPAGDGQPAADDRRGR